MINSTFFSLSCCCGRCALRALAHWILVYRPIGLSSAQYFFPTRWQSFGPKHASFAHTGRPTGSISVCMGQNSYYSLGSGSGQHNVTHEQNTIEAAIAAASTTNFICGSDFSPRHICSRSTEIRIELQQELFFILWKQTSDNESKK